jgi:hypothetical protein
MAFLTLGGIYRACRKARRFCFGEGEKGDPGGLAAKQGDAMVTLLETALA